MSRTKKKKLKVFVGMSGGVDSSVAAALLLQEGHDVVGVHIKCWSPTNDCGVQDAEDARRVAEKLNIPFYVWNFEDEYKAKVVDYMIEGYRKGQTPNPDIMCNREIKFGIFLEKALRLGADYVATGHYVRLGFRVQGLGYRRHPGRPLNSKSYILYSARDLNKDQSYFLWTLTQKQLKHCLFPIGEFEKKKVREMAKKFGLPTAEKKDSQGICFMGHITIDEFLRDYIPQKPGTIVTTEGRAIGEHKGIYPYTIGQRHGLNLGIKNQELGIKGRHKTLAHYVSGKDVKTNTVIVAEGESNAALYRKEIELSDLNFIRDCKNLVVDGQMQVLVRIRYRQPLQKARLLFAYSRELANSLMRAKLVFHEPVKFVAEGQSAVFYTPDGEMIGGGIIA